MRRNGRGIILNTNNRINIIIIPVWKTRFKHKLFKINSTTPTIKQLQRLAMRVLITLRRSYRVD